MFDHISLFFLLINVFSPSVMVARQSAFISSANFSNALDQLDRCLNTKSIRVPSGWIEACVQWLLEEHGGMEACSHLTKTDWSKLLYNQWLHCDLHELSCPVLPSSTSQSGAMKLEGELCLQVVDLINVAESYYSQMRCIQGNLSQNLPAIETWDELNDENSSLMTQAMMNKSNRFQHSLKYQGNFWSSSS